MNTCCAYVLQRQHVVEQAYQCKEHGDNQKAHSNKESWTTQKGPSNTEMTHLTKGPNQAATARSTRSQQELMKESITRCQTLLRIAHHSKQHRIPWTKVEDITGHCTPKHLGGAQEAPYDSGSAPRMSGAAQMATNTRQQNPPAARSHNPYGSSSCGTAQSNLERIYGHPTTPESAQAPSTAAGEHLTGSRPGPLWWEVSPGASVHTGAQSRTTRALRQAATPPVTGGGVWGPEGGERATLRVCGALQHRARGACRRHSKRNGDLRGPQNHSPCTAGH